MQPIRHWVRTAGITFGVAGWIAATSLWLAACGGGEEPAAETPEPAAQAPEPSQSRLDAEREKALAKLGAEHRANFEGSDDDQIRYTGETEDGAPFVAQMGGDVVVPEGFFDEIPPYPNGVPFAMMEAGDDMATVSIDSTDAPSDIYEFYKTNLTDDGWVFENDVTLANGRVVRAARGDRRAVIHFQEIDGGTRIGFMLTDAE
jgi:hypothetical protein